MANVAVPLRHWPRATTAGSRHFFYSCSHGTAAAAAATSSSSSSSCFFDDGGSPFFPFPSPPALTRPRNRRLPLRRLFFSSTPFLSRTVGFRGQGLSLRGSSPLEDGSSSSQEEGSDSELDPDLPKKSRNQKKREAHRAVRWGMDLAKFSPPHIKRILRAASLEKEVFDALMLVKRLGPDVREGRRRQFNYIGKLLRSAEPGLMDALIQASKDGDSSKLQAFSGLEACIVEDEYEEEEDTQYEDESQNYFDIARRWFDGLVDMDSSITDEVYSIYNVEFDRQELRKLVGRVQSIEERQVDGEKEEDDVALIRAKNSLARFLRALAKRSVAA